MTTVLIEWYLEDRDNNTYITINVLLGRAVCVCACVCVCVRACMCVWIIHTMVYVVDYYSSLTY